MSRRRRMVLRVVWFTIWSALVVGGYVWFKQLYQVPSVAPPPKAIAVNVAETQSIKFTTELAFVGSLSPARSVWVSPFVSGHVVGILFKDGQKVSKGDVLYQLDDRAARAELASAQSQLNLDRSRLERDTALQRSGLLPTETLESTQAKVGQSENTLAIKTLDLDLLTIKAPFSGHLGEHQANVGQYVSPGDHLVQLTDLHEFLVDFKVPERYLESIVRGANVSFTSSALTGQAFNGQVSFIDPSIDPATRTFLVKGTIENAENELRTGLFGQVVLDVGEPHDVLAVPAVAIVHQLTGAYVFKDVDGVARQTEVEIGDRRGDLIVITSGLSQGDLVVTSGQFRLRDGTLIDGTPTQPATSQTPTKAAKRS